MWNEPEILATKDPCCKKVWIKKNLYLLKVFFHFS